MSLRARAQGAEGREGHAGYVVRFRAAGTSCAGVRRVRSALRGMLEASSVACVAVGIEEF